jgi:hypothetical protein
MALTGRHNIAKMYTATTGTGTLTLTTAARGCNTFALAGVVDGEKVTYTIRDGADSEVGRGTYTASGTTLSRDAVLSSTNAGAKIDCTGSGTLVAVTWAAEDLQPFASYYADNGGDSVADAATDTALTIDTEWIDETGLASLAANEVTLARKGWYELRLQVLISSLTAFNGRCTIDMNDLGGSPKRGYTTAMGILSDIIFVGPITISAATDAYALGTVSFINNLGSTVTATVIDLTVHKIGNK